MASEFTGDSVSLSRIMLDHLNGWESKPATFILDDYEKDPPSLMLQQLSAATVVKRYINGSYIGTWPFAVGIRVTGEDSASRISATDCLNELAAWLTEKDDNGNYIRLPVIDSKRAVTGIEMTTVPSIVSRYDGGVSDYQATFSLEYKYSERR